MAPRTLLPLIALHSLETPARGTTHMTFQMATIIYWLALGAGEALLSEGSFDDSQLPSLLRRSVVQSIALIIPSVLVCSWLAGPDLLLCSGTTTSNTAASWCGTRTQRTPGDREHLGGLPAEADWSNAEPHLGEFRMRRCLAGTGGGLGTPRACLAGLGVVAGNIVGAVWVLAALALHFRAGRHLAKSSGSQRLRKAGDDVRVDNPISGDRRDVPLTQFPGAQPPGPAKAERRISSRRVCSAPDERRLPSAARLIEFRDINREPSVPAAETALSADLVICTYSLARWNLLAHSVESALAQHIAPQQLIIVVDHNEELLERCRREWAGGRPDSPVEIIVVANQFPAGWVRHATPRCSTPALTLWPSSTTTPKRRLTGSSDCSPCTPTTPEPSPSAGRRGRTTGAATVVVPARLRLGVRLPLPLASRPARSGAPSDRRQHERAPRRHPRRRRVPRRRPRRHGPLHRIAYSYGPAAVCYEPRAEVHHYVAPERLTWSYFWRRCFYVNRSKVRAFADMGEAGHIGAELRFGVRVLLGLGPALSPR